MDDSNPPAKRRKASPPEPASDDHSHSAEASHQASDDTNQPMDTLQPSKTSTAPPPPSSDPTISRLEKFRALQARKDAATKSNTQATQRELKAASVNPQQLASLSRKHALASHNLLKADAAASGEDFERKRAWDWTIEESEKWDKRQRKKERHREDVAFQDYRQDARKIYKRQQREMDANGMREEYERTKAERIEQAAKDGGLDVVEMEDGELVAIDRDGSWYSTAETTTHFSRDGVNGDASKPSKAAIDRLVGDIKKAEETRLAKRRARGMKDGDEGDVTFINDKNKQFNQKLARFYDRYTVEIRDSFERGTMI